MTLTAASFKRRFAEFDETSDELVELALSEAENITDERVFGDTYKQAVWLQAAHILSISPGGMQARLEAKDGSTTYSAARKELEGRCAGGGIAVGQLPGETLSAILARLRT